jgi:RNA polymerase sigma-70 factor (ECF subfamily)
MDRRSRTASRASSELPPADSSPELRADVAILQRSLLDLPAELVQVIDGAYYEGASAQALAERWSVPTGTVKSRLARAIARLRERLIPAEGSNDA